LAAAIDSAFGATLYFERVDAHLAAKIGGGVGLMVDCCGVPVL